MSKENPPPYNEIDPKSGLPPTGYLQGSQYPPPPQVGFAPPPPHSQYPPPPIPGQQIPQYQGHPPHTGATSTNVNVQVTHAPGVYACPVCHSVEFESYFPCSAWLTCWIFFPCGIICCMLMQRKKCARCGFRMD